jgi:hypothetical protein
MEAVRISETSVYFCETTRRHIPEGCYLYTVDYYVQYKGATGKGNVQQPSRLR